MLLIVLIALGWLAGLWLASWLGWAWWIWLALGLVAGLALGVLRRFSPDRFPRFYSPLVFGLCLALAGVRYELARPVFDAGAVAHYNDQGVAALEGVICGEPEPKDTRLNLRLCVETMFRPGDQAARPAHGTVLVSAPRYSEERLAATGEAEFRYGDRLNAAASLVTPPEFERFSYKDYLARQDVYTLLPNAQITFIAARQANPAAQALYDFKARAMGVLAQLFPEPDSALLQGILLGNDSGLPADLGEAFRITGTAHIIAISGFNIAILAGLFAAAARGLFGRHWASLVAPLIGLVFYTILVGASASVVRAAIMGSLTLVAQRIGRGGGLNTLAAAVLGMTFFNPLWLWDVGFQLSAMATLGLMLYAEPFETALQNGLARFIPLPVARRAATLSAELFLLTLAAQLTTLPLMVYYFRSLSLISLLANLFILPAQPALMILAGLALCLGLVALPLGQLAAYCAWPFSVYTLALVRWFASLPGAALPLDDVAPWAVALFYLALFGLTWMLSRAPEQRPKWWNLLTARWAPAAALTVLATCGLIAWSAYFSLPDERLKIVILDVGQGDGVLIQLSSGANVLIDGGPSGGTLTRAVSRNLPLFARDLDLLVLAASRDESLGGLPDLLDRYRVKRVVVTSAPGDGAAYKTVQARLAQLSVERVSAADLPVCDLGDGVRLRALSDGDHGSAWRLEWKRFSLLLPIGLRLAEETDWLMHGRAEPVTALLLADHGSEKATQIKWIETLNPRVTLISAGAGNALGLPALNTLKRLEGRTVLRTDLHGTITLSTDGEQLWVETER